ncbi:MAG: DUF1116 domain-containing protein, partial [Gemmatimonadetes bacterium]|nr:DUF1116 domain-containing protein [Gemmatimonadota bacterium]
MRNVADEIRRVLSPLTGAGQVNVTEGAFGVSVEINASLLFAPGEAALGSNAVSALQAVAQVLAPAMWCFEVSDGVHAAYSPVAEGPPPALRFGSDDPLCVGRARDWCSRFAAACNPLLARRPVDPYALMCGALGEGDDCHARTL